MPNKTVFHPRVMWCELWFPRSLRLGGGETPVGVPPIKDNAMKKERWFARSQWTTADVTRNNDNDNNNNTNMGRRRPLAVTANRDLYRRGAERDESLVRAVYDFAYTRG